MLLCVNFASSAIVVGVDFELFATHVKRVVHVEGAMFFVEDTFEFGFRVLVRVKIVMFQGIHAQCSSMLPISNLVNWLR